MVTLYMIWIEPYDVLLLAAVVISDPKFVGPHSVMKVALASALRFASHFSLEVRPESADGTLLYLGQTRDAKHLDFFSLALRYGSLSGNKSRFPIFILSATRYKNGQTDMLG